MNPENFKITSVSARQICIEIIDPSLFDGQFSLGSYIKIPFKNDTRKYVVGVISNYKIKDQSPNDAETEDIPPSFILEVKLIGVLNINGEQTTFERGGHGIPLPPNNGISLLSQDELRSLYQSNINQSEEFSFSRFSLDADINVPINGNKLFNKHFAIVGSTGSGKSHTVAKVLQKAVANDGTDYSLNNSHIVVFDIHGEYESAFPDSNNVDTNNIQMPYWLFDSDELADLFIESNENNSHNQVSQFRYAVTENKKRHNRNPDIQENKIFFDSPLRFSIVEVIQYIKNLNNEVIGKLEGEGLPKKSTGDLIENRIDCYFTEEVQFCEQSTAAAKRAVAGPYKNDFERFLLRLQTTVQNPRLDFIFRNSDTIVIEGVLKQFIGYIDENKSNVTIFDLSGIPFEVLSIVVSVISRMLFEYGYYYKRLLNGTECETPLLLVYEEAHKYVPKSDLTKYRSSRNSIERIAKEGRKYGVTLAIVSQRPSEISETIFSQCNNFIVMRLTNSEDQNYVKKLLPDTLGNIIDLLPSLESGEALITGDSIIIPTLVKIDECTNKPASSDIKYIEIWRKAWKDVDMSTVITEWQE